MRPTFIDDILKPFTDNASKPNQLKELQDDLRTQMGRNGVTITESRMNPFTVCRDIVGSLIGNLSGEHPNYKRAALDLLMLGLQAMPAYVKSDFEKTPNGTRLEEVEFNYTGITLPLATLPLRAPFLGGPVFALNFMEIISGLISEGRFKWHEWNHLFDKYVVVELQERGLVNDAEGACRELSTHGAAISYEPPYQQLTLDEMRSRATTIVDILVPQEHRTQFPQYFSEDQQPTSTITA